MYSTRRFSAPECDDSGFLEGSRAMLRSTGYEHLCLPCIAQAQLREGNAPPTAPAAWLSCCGPGGPALAAEGRKNLSSACSCCGLAAEPQAARGRIQRLPVPKKGKGSYLPQPLCNLTYTRCRGPPTEVTCCSCWGQATSNMLRWAQYGATYHRSYSMADHPLGACQSPALAPVIAWRQACS